MPDAGNGAPHFGILGAQSSVGAWLSSSSAATGSIKKEQHVEFLEALRARLKQPLLIVWDSLKAQRSKLVREHLDSTGGQIQMAFLPP